MPGVSDEVQESLRLIEDLKFFLVTAPANWQENQVIRRYYLNNDEGFVSCVFWNNLYFVTGTDIVRCILYKFQHFGRTVTDRKKFEEGVFSDLRNLKSGSDAILENPKLEFLEFLYKNSCLRTQKKQKVFFWFNVPHDKLMADALERDIKKENSGQIPTSVALREPALLFDYVEDKSRSLYEQLSDHLSLKYEDTASVKPDPDTRGSPDYVSTSAKVPDEEDDDFPLDYLDKEWGRVISLDGNYHSGSFINSYDNNFENMDSFFLQNAPANVVSNEDYLIEQTQPLKTAASASQMFFPRLAKVDDAQYVQYAPQFHPVSATGSQFPGYPVQFPGSAVMAQFPPMPIYEHGYHEPHVYPEEYWSGSGAPLVHFEAPLVHYEAPPSNPLFGFYDDYEYSMYNAKPSLRQQEVSSTMMRKRQQIQPLRRAVSKPENDRARIADYEAKLRACKRDSDAAETDTLIPTPESFENAAEHPEPPVV